MFWGVVSLVFVVFFVFAVSFGLIRGIRRHPRDVRIVDMRNRGLSAAEIAAALGTTESVIREDLKRLTIRLGDTG